MERNGLATPGDITPRRNPFELWVVVACTLTGALSLLPLGGPRQGAIDRHLPVLSLPWYVGLLVGGCVALIGTLWRSRTIRSVMRSLAFERVGLIIICGLTFGYGGALVVTALRAPSGLLLLGLAVASAIRVRQINREMKVIEAALQETWRDDDTG